MTKNSSVVVWVTGAARRVVLDLGLDYQYGKGPNVGMIGIDIESKDAPTLIDLLKKEGYHPHY